ncbi:hypothetical protein BT96DRAFT_973785 [Gymnopus androsaceus JB14]|uniref:Uncharacterized protein n=1 Tax=Gymnopus androsaceus JB14 TaxID=1447944 RepID=A0A6A4I3I4_9AGAR|nr:hypothetical protein BT96DRAFT_973785 [Gymnopus androsaceus JB14]
MAQTHQVLLLTFTLTRFIVVLNLSSLANSALPPPPGPPPADQNKEGITISSSWPIWKIVVFLVVFLFLGALVVLIFLRRRQLQSRFFNKNRTTASGFASAPLIGPSPPGPTNSIGLSNQTLYDPAPRPFIPMQLVIMFTMEVLDVILLHQAHHQASGYDF